MSEKALSIGTYFVASGVYVIFGTKNPVSGSEEVLRLISEGWESKVDGLRVSETTSGARFGGLRRSTRTQTSGRSAALERGKPTHRFFETLESTHDHGWHIRMSFGVMEKPMRGGFVEARSQGRWGEYLGEVNAKRGSAAGPRVTPVRSERTLRMRKPLESQAGT
jgi:hypothetical protein